jgi:predicted DsbA family dithiol-disulfide isomerase
VSTVNDTRAPSTALCWYDFVCPFCYIGQSRTATLMAAGINVISLPFQSHPEIPAGGIFVGPRRGASYLTLERQAAAAGLALRWPVRIPNSRRALATAEWVRGREPEAFPEVQHRLFEAHFALGEDIDDQAVIDRRAVTAGVDLAALHADLADGSAYAAVDRAEIRGRRHGVAGTPTWLLGGRLIAGLKPESEFQLLARKVLGGWARSERTLP